jgi:AGZA family xanthine/uracil permease-like MFS transporter
MYGTHFPSAAAANVVPKFTYSIVGFHGTGIVPYREALAAVFMEGYVRSSLTPRIKCLIVLDRWIFFALSLLGLRQWLARIMPQSLVLSVGAGIGLFIAYVMYFLFVPSP